MDYKERRLKNMMREEIFRIALLAISKKYQFSVVSPEGLSQDVDFHNNINDVIEKISKGAKNVYSKKTE